MEENRPFDHLLGFLKKLNPNVDGLTGEESNPLNPKENRTQVHVSFDQTEYMTFDPNHSVPGTTKELYGEKAPEGTAPMNGFVWENNHTEVMRCFNASSLPTLYTLAQEFALFDRWFAGVPGPTLPNRMYFLSGTSHGWATNPVLDFLPGVPQRTIFNMFQDAGLDWASYYQDAPGTLIFDQVREQLDRVRIWDDFLSDAKAGTLPHFSFIEPRYFSLLDWVENDQHPPSSIKTGEFLMKEVYEALRSSPQWNETLLIITYDEHGGLYDHVSPPTEDVPSPDGIESTDPPFDFTRLGLRVPTLMISPWIERGEVVHRSPSSSNDFFSASSVISTMRQIFPELAAEAPLTKRDAWAATFEHVISRTTPRTDCPETLPTLSLGPRDAPELTYANYKRWQDTPVTEELLRSLLDSTDVQAASEASGPLSHLQQEMLMTVWRAAQGGASLSAHQELERWMDEATVHEAALYLRKLIATWRESVEATKLSGLN